MYIYVLTYAKQANKRNDILDYSSFAVPVFHAYGHTGECQVLLLTSVHQYIHGCIAMYV